MKMKSVVLLAVALGFGFVAMLGVQQAMRAKPSTAKTKSIIISRTEIEAFTTKLDQTNVTFDEYPLDKVPEDAIINASEYEDRALKYHVPPKTIITRQMLTSKGQIGVANLIPKGMRMATIKASSTQTHSYMMKPGDRIDILVTFKPAGDSRPSTKTVLEDIKVFSLDKLRTGNETEAEGKSKNENLSVLVTPQQAARLSMAGAKGELHTVLRNPDDKSKTDTNLLTDEDFVGADASGGKDRELHDPGEMPKIPIHVVEPPPAPEPITQVVVDTTRIAEPEPEPEHEIPAVKPWVLEIYEGDTLRKEEIFPAGVEVPKSTVDATGINTPNDILQDAIRSGAVPGDTNPAATNPSAPGAKPKKTGRDKLPPKTAGTKKTKSTTKTAAKLPASAS